MALFNTIAIRPDEQNRLGPPLLALSALKNFAGTGISSVFCLDRSKSYCFYFPQNPIHHVYWKTDFIAS